jgi:hypothetical protein
MIRIARPTKNGQEIFARSSVDYQFSYNPIYAVVFVKKVVRIHPHVGR